MNNLIEMLKEVERQKKDDEKQKKDDERDVRIKELENQKKGKKSDITIGSQILLLHYLNLLPDIKLSGIEKAKLLKYIFKADGDENIRKGISKLGEIHTKEFEEPFTKANLKRVCKIFEELGLKSEFEKAESDLRNKEK
jgi:hypothetical protein